MDARIARSVKWAIQLVFVVAAFWAVILAGQYGFAQSGVMGAAGGVLLAAGLLGVLYYAVRLALVKLLERLMTAVVYRLWLRGTTLEEVTDGQVSFGESTDNS